MPQPPDTSTAWARIIIVAFRSGKHIDECLSALAAQTFSSFEAIIVDNGCPDGCLDGVELPDERFRIVHSQRNRGFAGGVNLGAQGADTPWILTVNPDAFPAPDWLEHLQRASEAYPFAGALGTTLLNETGDALDGFGDVYSMFGFAWQGGHGASPTILPGHDVRVFSISAAAAAYRRDVFEQAGGFEEIFFSYLEDMDLGIRIRGLGYECIEVRQAVARHIGSASLGKGSNFQYFHSWRNQFLLLIRNAPLMWLVPQLCLHLMASAYVLFRNRKSQGAAARFEGWKAGAGNMINYLGRRKGIRRLGPTAYFGWLSKTPSDFPAQKPRFKSLD